MKGAARSRPVTVENANRADQEGKVRTLVNIREVCAEIRARGETIAMCHGVFDLLHVGHLYHLQSAKKLADRLIVTITADSYVHKGPGRPVFPTEVRAEMLAALSIVDLVVPVPDVSAIPAIEEIRPNIYVKGGEYADAEKDVTGKIDSERELVEHHGGRIEFTYQPTFSSSKLLNDHFGLLNPTLKAYLQMLSCLKTEATITDLMAKVGQLDVLLVGDTIIDEYVYVAPMGKTSKDNLVATLLEGREVFAGGVIAAANHLASFCRSVEVMTVIGDPHRGENYEQLIRDTLQPNVTLKLSYHSDAPTTRKIRYVEISYLRKLFEVYEMDDSFSDDASRWRFDADMASAARARDAVVVTDFGHGLIGPSTIKAITLNAKFLAVNAQTNGGNTGFNLITRYPRANYICIDGPEARLAIGDNRLDFETICGDALPTRVDCDKIVVTAGKDGCFAYERDVHRALHSPAVAGQVVDAIGAGDAFFAITAPFVAVGADMRTVSFLGNIAGAIKVGIVGHRSSVSKSTLQKYVTTLLK